MSELTPDILKERAVRVNNGSGVLLPAMSLEYTYVLTARHNVLADEKKLETILPLDQVVVTLLDDSNQTPMRVVFSPEMDAAVLLIPKIEVEPIAFSSDVSLKQDMWLIGYPQLRQDGGDDPIRIYPGAIQSYSKGEIKVSTNDYAGIGEVRGCSGGGVYTLVDKRWVLVGIEYGMDNRAEEGHNWLRCSNISIFEKLLAAHSLPSILPPFLLSFSELVSSAFPLPGFECSQTKKAVQSLLQYFASQKLGEDCPTPHDLLCKYEELLLVYGDPRYSLADKKLWVSWLELLVLSIILDDKKCVDDSYIDFLRKKRRLLYSGSSNEWLDFIEKILQSNFDGLDKDGVVFISNNRDSPPIKSKPSRDLSKIIADIGLPLDGYINIGLSRKKIVPRKLLHLDGLHIDCVVKKEADYSVDHGHHPKKLLKILRKAYRAALA